MYACPQHEEKHGKEVTFKSSIHPLSLNSRGHFIDGDQKVILKVYNLLSTLSPLHFLHTFLRPFLVWTEQGRDLRMHTIVNLS